jgi:hypothetical protein
MTTHSLSRRDMLKMSALGAAALALPFERIVRAKSISRIASSKLPRPFTVPSPFPRWPSWSRAMRPRTSTR